MCGMNKEFFLGAIFGTSFLGFCLLYLRMGKVRLLSRLLNRTREGMEASARQRLLADRIRLGEFERRHSLWMYLEKQLHYSGLHIRFPNLTVEKGIAVVLFCEVLVKNVWAFGLWGGIPLSVDPGHIPESRHDGES